MNSPTLLGKPTTAYLVLDDGRIFEGKSWAKSGEAFGEAVFSTGMTGYQETLTDPSYHKQIVIMNSPTLLGKPTTAYLVLDDGRIFEGKSWAVS